jgi:hypothetical protein
MCSKQQVKWDERIEKLSTPLLYDVLQKEIAAFGNC